MILRYKIHGIFPQNKDLNFSTRSTNMFLLRNTGQDALKSKHPTPKWSARNRTDSILARDTGVMSSLVRQRHRRNESSPFLPLNPR